MAVDLLLGLQWGDEGKGKIVDVLTKNYDIIARFQGGPNAGHTLIFDGHKHVLHTIPSGIFHKTALNVVGNGVVIDPVIFKKELENLDKHEIDYTSKLLISRKAHLILPTHRLLDAASETSKGKAKIGSTLKGIGPTYMDKTGRNGMRVGDLELENWKEKYDALTAKHIKMLEFFDVQIEYDLNELEAEFIKGIDKLKTLAFIDSEEFLNQAIKDKKTILAEGAQGSLLDIDFGTYPFVTSSNTTAAGACTGLGVAPNRIGDVFGIFKAYTTRVGSGPFPTELFDDNGKHLAAKGHEFGATTGRARRCGWFDAVGLRHAIQINSVSGICLTKLDVLDGLETIKVCVAYNDADGNPAPAPVDSDDYEKVVPVYEEVAGWSEQTLGAQSLDQLPTNARAYINRLEELVGAPIDIVSTGPDRIETIVLRHPFE